MADDDRLLDLLERWQSAHAQGHPVSVAELCGDRPDLIEPLQEKIRFVNRLDALANKLPESASEPTTVGPSPDPQETRSLPGQSSQPCPGGGRPPAVGEDFAGFRLLGVLGEGGFGTVFRAEDLRLRRKVALKVLHARALAREGAIHDFLAEARALASVQHDHVVPIFQVGEEGGQPFLAMPLLGGETLASRIEREGALSPDEVRRIGREIAAGLAAIHAKGLIHRDLKPGNIWLEVGTGRVKVLDLGLAQDALAAVDSIAGTPSYMSPEQAEGRELDLRSDLFSLGTVLYECASGRRPFRKHSVAETLQAIREETPPSVHRANPAIPSDVSSVLERLHRKDPGERPASAREVETLLQAGPTTQSAAIPASPVEIKHRFLWPVAAVGVLVLPLIAYLAWSLASNNPTTQPTTDYPKADAVVLPALRFKTLEVSHLVDAESPQPRKVGIVGKSPSQPIHIGHAFRVEATLLRPAYAYLLAFRPDGGAALLYPQDEAEVPEKAEQVVYPSKRLAEAYVMEPEEGPGVWMVVAFASEEPLPSYREWRAAHPGGPWKPQKSAHPSGWVWLYDGRILDVTERGQARASKQLEGLAPIVDVADWLKRQSGSEKSPVAVSAVAFSVAEEP